MSWVVTEVDASGRALWRSKWLPTRDVAEQVAADLRRKIHGAWTAGRPGTSAPYPLISSLLADLPKDPLPTAPPGKTWRTPPAPTARL